MYLAYSAEVADDAELNISRSYARRKRKRCRFTRRCIGNIRQFFSGNFNFIEIYKAGSWVVDIQLVSGNMPVEFVALFFDVYVFQRLRAINKFDAG